MDEVGGTGENHRAAGKTVHPEYLSQWGKGEGLAIGNVYNYAGVCMWVWLLICNEVHQPLQMLPIKLYF